MGFRIRAIKDILFASCSIWVSERGSKQRMERYGVRCSIRETYFCFVCPVQAPSVVYVLPCALLCSSLTRKAPVASVIGHTSHHPSKASFSTLLQHNLSVFRFVLASEFHSPHPHGSAAAPTHYHNHLVSFFCAFDRSMHQRTIDNVERRCFSLYISFRKDAQSSRSPAHRCVATESQTHHLPLIYGYLFLGMLYSISPRL